MAAAGSAIVAGTSTRPVMANPSCLSKCEGKSEGNKRRRHSFEGEVAIAKAFAKRYKNDKNKSSKSPAGSLRPEMVVYRGGKCDFAH